jgi:protein-disulfide isomerase
MYRRFLVIFSRKAFLFLLLICLGCSAQSAPPDLTRTIERHVRALYSVPHEVNINIGPLRASDFPNYDATTVSFEGGGAKPQQLEFLISKDRKTLLRLTKMDLTTDPYSERMKRIDVAGRPTRGNKDAKVVVVDYDDFECPFCSRMHQTLFPQILKEYGDRVLFIYKDYPLEEIHPWAVHAAVDANCLATQNNDAYWDFADYVHGNQAEINKDKGKQAATLDKLATLQGQKHKLDDAKLQACLKAQDDKAVRASMKEGDKVGVNATPTLFVNGEKIDGALSTEEIRATFNRTLKDEGVAPGANKVAESQSAKPTNNPTK